MPPHTTSFTCPRCKATSHNPNDKQHGYCGRCHAFTGDPTAPETPEFIALARAFARWSTDPQPVVIQLPSRWEAWCLLSMLQLVSRHPDLSPEFLSIAQDLGRAIQGQLCDTPDLQALAEAGWNPDRDI